MIALHIRHQPQRPMSTVSFRRAAIAAGLALVVSACTDEDKNLPSEPQFTEPGIHPVLVIAAQSASARAGLRGDVAGGARGQS